MKWIKRKANKQWTCILCREIISEGDEYIPPPVPNKRTPIVPGHKTTWEEWPTAFHVDCFKNLKQRFKSPVYVYHDYEWKEMPDC